MKNLVMTMLMLSSIALSAQVAISDSSPNPTPDSAAIFDLQSVTRGFLPPRMTTTERDAIASPPDGLIIYNTTTSCVDVYVPVQGWASMYCDCNIPPSAAFTGTNPATQYSSASFSASSSGLNYAWTFQNGSPASSNAQSPSVTWSTPGNYNVSLTVTDGNGCTASSSQSITVNACTPPSAGFTNPGTGSINVAQSFSANAAGQNYAWTFPSGSPATSSSATPSVTWTVAGTYTIQLIVSDANGCADTSTQNITIQNCVSGIDTIIYTGNIVTWTPPSNPCGNFTIEVWGAQGGHNGGHGTRMRGDFTTAQLGSSIKILVGEEGDYFDGSTYDGGGGGGGTFVTTSTNSPLIIAGGGGGRTTTNAGATYGATTSMNASTSTTGGSTLSNGGGTGGNGGSNGISNGPAGGGGGLLTDGQNGSSGATGGRAFVNGGAGGGWNGNNEGGFGGGGGGYQTNFHRSGGGGGYSGGQGGTWDGQQSGGGGGSYNIGTNQSNAVSNRFGDGMVIITW